MKKFIVVYHAPVRADQQVSNASPEEMQKGMEQWMTWAKNCGEKLVDIGSPLANGLKLSTSGEFVSSKKEVTGYSVLEANNIEEAKGLLNGHPHISGWNSECSIEIYETMPIPGM